MIHDLDLEPDGRRMEHAPLLEAGERHYIDSAWWVEGVLVVESGHPLADRHLIRGNCGRVMNALVFVYADRNDRGGP